jgi:uncharacterized protein YybS (DUF2232 family)
MERKAQMNRGVNDVNTGIRPLAWSAAAIFLLVLTAMPVLNMPAVLLLAVPFTVLFVLLTPVSFALHVAVIFSLASFMLGPAILLVGLFFLIPAAVMGYFYKRRAPASTVMTAGGVSILSLFLLEMLLLSAFLDINMTAELAKVIRGNADRLATQGLLPVGWDDETTEALAAATIQSLPRILILAAFTFAVVTHWLSRRALARAGLDMPAFRKAREWMLPRALVFVYLAVLVLYMIQLSAESPANNSYFGMIIVNLYYLIWFVFACQTIGFFFYLAHQKGWHRIVPLILSVPVLMFQPLSLIGVFDTAFPLRKSIGKS